MWLQICIYVYCAAVLQCMSDEQMWTGIYAYDCVLMVKFNASFARMSECISPQRMHASKKERCLALTFRGSQCINNAPEFSDVQQQLLEIRTSQQPDFDVQQRLFRKHKALSTLLQALSTIIVYLLLLAYLLCFASLCLRLSWLCCAWLGLVSPENAWLGWALLGIAWLGLLPGVRNHETRRKHA